MKNIYEQQSFILSKLLPLFSIIPNEDIVMKLSDEKIIQLNNLLPEIKKIFVTKNFNFHKMNNMISTEKQAIALFKKCLIQAKIEFAQPKINILRLIDKNIISVDSYKMSEIHDFDETKIENIKKKEVFLTCNNKTCLTLPHEILTPIPQIVRNIKLLSSIPMEIEIMTMKNSKRSLIRSKKTFNNNDNIFLSKILPYVIDQYYLIFINCYTSVKNHEFSLELEICKINTTYMNKLLKGEYVFKDNDITMNLKDGKVEFKTEEQLIKQTKIGNFKEVSHTEYKNLKIVEIEPNDLIDDLVTIDFLMAFTQNKCDMCIGKYNPIKEFKTINYAFENNKSFFIKTKVNNKIFISVIISRCFELLKKVTYIGSFIPKFLSNGNEINIVIKDNSFIFENEQYVNILHPYYSNVIEFESLIPENNEIILEYEIAILDNSLRKELIHKNILISLDEISDMKEKKNEIL